MRIALFEPDIPQNAGALMRLAACLGVGIDIVGPPGFVLSDAKLRRAGLDYAVKAALTTHAGWEDFQSAVGPGCRLLLLTTKGDTDYRDADYRAGDILMVGRESAGVPDFVHEAADLRLVIPLAEGMRSLNVATTAAMVLGEALRQTGGFPGDKERGQTP
ncbi:MAG TPA: tRNA (cytidine(34)-2'-O)-methyltransferase [Alphaproteobacteria bacterium]|nr:tRNA (cytidine(34)-2'-O)-methyltransferase [Alphaproteobacteria bacterium]